MISSLKFYRLIRQMKQFDLAVQTLIPPYKISNLENGKVEPTEDELKRLAAALQTTTEALQRQVGEELLTT